MAVCSTSRTMAFPSRAHRSTWVLTRQRMSRVQRGCTRYPPPNLSATSCYLSCSHSILHQLLSTLANNSHTSIQRSLQSMQGLISADRHSIPVLRAGGTAARPPRARSQASARDRPRRKTRVAQARLALGGKLALGRGRIKNARARAWV